MNEAKVKEVLDYCYEQAHNSLAAHLHRWDTEGVYETLENIEEKLESLTDDDLEAPTNGGVASYEFPVRHEIDRGGL